MFLTAAAELFQLPSATGTCPHSGLAYKIIKRKSAPVNLIFVSVIIQFLFLFLVNRFNLNLLTVYFRFVSVDVNCTGIH